MEAIAARVVRIVGLVLVLGAVASLIVEVAPVRGVNLTGSYSVEARDSGGPRLPPAPPAPPVSQPAATPTPLAVLGGQQLMAPDAPRPGTSARVERVTTTDVHLRPGPSATGRPLAVLGKGWRVTVIKGGPAWSKIEHAGRVGYVATRYLAHPV